MSTKTAEGLRKIFDDYANKGGYIMNLIPKIEKLYNISNYSFVIDKITKERRIDGNTRVTATCVETNKTVNIILSHDDFTKKEIVKQKLLEAHKVLCETDEEQLQEGDII